MTVQSKVEAAPATVAEMLDRDDAWRPALAAFYAASGQSQGAINIRTYSMRLDASDRMTIDALRAAFAVMA